MWRWLFSLGYILSLLPQKLPWRHDITPGQDRGCLIIFILLLSAWLFYYETGLKSIEKVVLFCKREGFSPFFSDMALLSQQILVFYSKKTSLFPPYFLLGKVRLCSIFSFSRTAGFTFFPFFVQMRRIAAAKASFASAGKRQQNAFSVFLPAAFVLKAEANRKKETPPRQAQNLPGRCFFSDEILWRKFQGRKLFRLRKPSVWP